MFSNLGLDVREGSAAFLAEEVAGDLVWFEEDSYPITAAGAGFSGVGTCPDGPDSVISLVLPMPSGVEVGLLHELFGFSAHCWSADIEWVVDGLDF